MNERSIKKSVENRSAPLQEKLEIFQAFLDLSRELNTRIGEKIAESARLNERIRANSQSVEVLLLFKKQIANNVEIAKLLELGYKAASAMKQAEYAFEQKAGINPSLGEMRSRPDARSN